MVLEGMKRALGASKSHASASSKARASRHLAFPQCCKPPVSGASGRRTMSARAGDNRLHSLEIRGVAVLAELGAEQVADLAERDALLDGVEDRRHDVLAIVAQGCAHGGQRLIGRGAVALVAELLDPIDLRGLGRMLDLERRDVVALLGGGVLVDADDRPAAEVDVALELERRARDLA